MSKKVLWISDEDAGCEGCEIPQQPDFSITQARTLFELRGYLEAGEFDAVVAAPLQDESMETVLEEVCQSGAMTPVLVYCECATISDAVRWTKLGACQVLREFHSVPQAIEAALSSKQIRRLAAHVAHAGAPSWRKLLIGESRGMHHVAEIVRLVAARRCTVLITGETGTGKEVVARAIHAASGRCGVEMVSVNCSALPEHLLEAELFGHVRGAFTGATGSRVGRFEQANRGTIFLDEIGDMPLALQSKLLRVLQEREFQRLGSSETVRVDVRVIAATNANLVEKVRDGEFREDLYYRLNVVPIAVPPLRERLSDIPLLVTHFINKICQDEDLPRKHASDEVHARLARHEWPGNVRQLENAVEMAIALSGERRILCPGDFPLPAKLPLNRPAPPPFVAIPDQGLDFEKTMGGIELNILEQALRKTGGNKKMAAEMLGLKRTTLTAKLKSLTESGTVLNPR